jgi:hypothetical protein
VPKRLGKDTGIGIHGTATRETPWKREGPLWMSAWGFCEWRILSALSVGSKWNEGHEANYPLSPHHLHLIYTNLHRPSDNMKWRNFLPIPKKHGRTRSKARSEIDPIEASSEADLAAPRPTESTPDLRIGTSTLPTPDPPISGDQKPSGTRATAFRTIRLTILPRNIDDDPARSVPSDAHLTVDPVAAHENKSTWKSTAYSTTKLAINMVKESSAPFLRSSPLWEVSPLSCNIAMYAPPLSHHPVNDAHGYLSKRWRVAKR